MAVYPVSSGTITCRAYDSGGTQRAALSNSTRGSAILQDFNVPEAAISWCASDRPAPAEAAESLRHRHFLLEIHKVNA